MEEPVPLLQEPQDEPARQELPAGVFTGIYVTEASQELEELGSEGNGVRVSHVVENSPGDGARIQKGDILLSLKVNQEPKPRPLDWPSEWRQAELQSSPGDRFQLLYERAGVEAHTSFRVVARLHPARRKPVHRLREEERAGIVIRGATQVEARKAGLGPGAGAVLVGMARGSPWRQAGLHFGDLIRAIDGEQVAHPEQVLSAIHDAAPDRKLKLSVQRGEERLQIKAPLSRRARELKSLKIPLLFNHERDRGHSDTSLLLGLLGYESTTAAWEFKILWFITIRGGEADRLKEIKP